MLPTKNLLSRNQTNEDSDVNHSATVMQAAFGGWKERQRYKMKLRMVNLKTLSTRCNLLYLVEDIYNTSCFSRWFGFKLSFGGFKCDEIYYRTMWQGANM